MRRARRQAARGASRRALLDDDVATGAGGLVVSRGGTRRDVGRRTVGDGASGIEESRLDRTSFVPLYYQLQEILKQEIESGRWRPGDALPSEQQLARRHGISRIVVRQALSILADDRQIERVRGRGTFVARPKLESRAGGLCRLIMSTAASNCTIYVLQKRFLAVESSVQKRLDARSSEAFCLTFALSIARHVVAISHSFFRPEDADWIEPIARVGEPLEIERASRDRFHLAHSEVSIETSQCGNFEAEQFALPVRAPVFLVHCVELIHDRDQSIRPLEFARVVYRADDLQFRLELTEATGSRNLEAVWALNPAGQPL
jgi:GntR family transcriptional regulator